MNAIVAEGLSKRYGQVVALEGLDLQVAPGTVMGLLGPNGAGKTTVVRILTTLLEPDSGRATVAGLDVVADAAELRRTIGLSGQNAAVDVDLTGYENLEMIGRLYHMGRAASRTRARELLERFDLTRAADRTVKTYSGGMRRRLDLAGALLSEPSVLFLDEPTTGLDPRSRLRLWEMIEELVASGSTVLLTTQYLEEADRLADQIAVIDTGKVIALGTADELKAQVGGERLELVVDGADALNRAAALLTPLGLGKPLVEHHSRRVTVPVAGGSAALVEAIRLLDAESIAVLDVAMRRPTLDDVFLALTGHGAGSPDGDDNDGEDDDAGGGARGGRARQTAGERSA